MRVQYHQLWSGEIPIYSAAKSRAVHVWIPRGWPKRFNRGRGWERQSNPIHHRKKPLPEDPMCLRDLNVLIPMFEVSRGGFSRWLKARAKQLGVTKGILHVVTRFIELDIITCGLYHDTRSFGDWEYRWKHGYKDLPEEILL